MKYVLDASVGVRWFLESSDYDKARQLRIDFQNRIHELVAPETILWETSNALINNLQSRFPFLKHLSTLP